MTNAEKSELRKYAKSGMTFDEIRPLVDCADSTIKKYIRVLAPVTQPINQD